MPRQEVYEEPIIPIFIDHEKEVQAYYSRVEEIAMRTPPPQNPHSQAPYLPYPDPPQYPAANYPQSYPGIPAPDPQFHTNPYGYNNQYYGQAPVPQYNTAYGYPYPPTNYPQYQYDATSSYPNPTYPPQVPPNQWGGQPVAPTNAPYPNYPYQNPMPGNQYNTTSPCGWGDLGLLLPSAPTQLETDHFHGHATSSDGNYIMEETIQASIAQRNFNENSSLLHQIEIGWKI